MNVPARTSIGIATVVLLAATSSALAQTIHAKLDGYQETPAVSTTGSGEFRAKVRASEGTIEWELSYEGLQGTVTQSHIHFGRSHSTGGVSAFLCTNLGNGPAGTQACPQSGTISGTIVAASVVGPAAQLIAAGEIAELIAAIRASAAYVNVHSTLAPGGEIRGEIR